MKMSKIALAGICAAGLACASTAQAASTRSTESLPSATVKAKKTTFSRSSSGVDGASSMSAAGTGLLVVGIGLAGWGFYEAVKGNDNADSPGGA